MIKRDEVKLEYYNSDWRTLYENESKNIISCIGNHIVRIEHVGSTSIHGLKAKPIIDIVIGLKDLSDGYNCIDKLRQIGYIDKGSLGKSNRFFFYKLEGEYEVYHLHLVKYLDHNWMNLILFRDYLAKNEDIKNEYQTLKENLVNDLNLNREEYTKSKSEFILKVIELAKTELHK